MGPEFHGNQDYVPIKVMQRRMFVLATHFIDECCDEETPFKDFAFVTIKVVNNASGLTHNQIEDLLLEKEKFWIGTLVTQHQRLNSTQNK